MDFRIGWAKHGVVEPVDVGMDVEILMVCIVLLEMFEIQKLSGYILL